MILTHGMNSISRYKFPKFINNFNNYYRGPGGIYYVNSLFGNPLESYSGLSNKDFGEIIASPNFIGDGCLKTKNCTNNNNESWVANDTNFPDIPNKGCITEEVYLSGLTSTKYSSWLMVSFPVGHVKSDGNGHKPLFQIEYYDQYTLYNGASQYDTTETILRVHGTPQSSGYNHIAVVVDFDAMEYYCYCNGVLYLKCHVTQINPANWIYVGYSGASYYLQRNIEFISVRQGDFSTNNRQSFPVPTEKYYI